MQRGRGETMDLTIAPAVEIHPVGESHSPLGLPPPIFADARAARPSSLRIYPAVSIPTVGEGYLSVMKKCASINAVLIGYCTGLAACDLFG
jgi:hypothetical protein